jgi:phospholipid-binding lipoprotein MlaA
MKMRSAFPRLLLAASLIALGACATRPPPGDQAALQEYQENNDPLEPTNRVFYAINNGIDTVLFRPAAIVYRHVVPGVVRARIHGVLANMSSPVLFVNDVLEAKPRRAGTTMMRFLINSTAGIGGMFDVATDLGYPEHDADFGITLALWGVGEGPFLFLPVLGPSSPRDFAGFGVDLALDPLTWASFPGSKTLGHARYGLNAVDTRERFLDQTDSIHKTALDPYATFRSLYRQNRQSTIDTVRQDNATTVPAWFNR